MSRIASQAIAEFAVKDNSIAQSAKPGLSGVGFAILAVFASPIALPLAFALIIMVASVLIFMLCLILFLGAMVLVLLMTGILCTIISIPIAFQNVPSFFSILE